MTQTITRMFATPGQAASAKALLEREGYADVHLVSGDYASASKDEITAAITKGYVLKSRAQIYAEGVRKGGSLVTVHAPFGGAVYAIRILDKFSPIDSGISETPPPSGIMLWDEATPMSCVLQMPVLMKEPAPFSRFWGLPLLASGSCALSSMFGIPLLKKFTQRSTSFGLPLLSSNPAPLSSLLGLPTLSKQK